MLLRDQRLIKLPLVDQEGGKGKGDGSAPWRTALSLLKLLQRLEVQAVLAGQDGRIEIWAAGIYDKIDMLSDDFANLAEKLMGSKLNDPEE